MPVIHINIRDGLTVEQKRGVARDITDVINKNLGIEKERTEIFFHDIPDQNFAKAGILLVDQDNE
ncbi:MAG: tautomerase family protein [Pseudomonadota bacterium]